MALLGAAVASGSTSAPLLTDACCCADQRPWNLVAPHLHEVPDLSAFRATSKAMQWALDGEAVDMDLVLPAPAPGPRVVTVSL